ncbi:MAG: hydrogenase nickel incorporation protein HypA [Clostridiales bacterium]|jgi:hydrogenase nickel incorporation protein HypA/HybF|nr:hydrogenase nickel incorporation protein HypA [Clostridiales bacterium]
MHEIGVLFEVVKSVERLAKENDVKKIETLVLQIGELSSMIPKYMKTLYPAAIDGTILEGSELEIEVLPANGLCRDCNKVFSLIENNGTCPLCRNKNFELLSGKEFFIKEIICC